jgi:effector-binding domain-containing protein
VKTLLVFILFSVVAMAIEEPAYTVTAKTENYEIRKYGPVIVAETKVAAGFEKAGNQAFRILAGYIFGGNKSKAKIAMTAPVSQTAALSEKIAMTAPVTQSPSSDGFLVQFTMPKQYSLETLPTPNDERVQLREIPARTVAVFSYSGSWSESRYQEKLSEFRLALQKNNVHTTGEPILARFNSPFRLWFLRRNEIWLAVTE